MKAFNIHVKDYDTKYFLGNAVSVRKTMIQDALWSAKEQKDARKIFELEKQLAIAEKLEKKLY